MNQSTRVQLVPTSELLLSSLPELSHNSSDENVERDNFEAPEYTVRSRQCKTCWGSAHTKSTHVSVDKLRNLVLYPQSQWKKLKDTGMCLPDMVSRVRIRYWSFPLTWRIKPALISRECESSFKGVRNHYRRRINALTIFAAL